MNRSVDLRLIPEHTEVAKIRRKSSFHGFLNQFFRLAAVFDQAGDGANFNLMFFGKFDQVLGPGHGSVIVHDFTDNSGRIKTG